MLARSARSVKDVHYVLEGFGQLRDAAAQVKPGPIIHLGN
jgi:hypothetical protein